MGEVGGERGEQADGALAAGLGLFELAVGEGALDEQAALTDVLPAEGERFAGPEAGVGEQGDERGVAQPAALKHHP